MQVRCGCTRVSLQSIIRITILLHTGMHILALQAVLTIVIRER